MYVGRNFDHSDPDESEPYTFDFVNDLLDGETIASAQWFCEVSDRSRVADASASSRLSGSPSNSGTKSTHRVVDLQPGVLYVLRAIVTTSQSNERSLWSFVECRDPQQ